MDNRLANKTGSALPIAIMVVLVITLLSGVMMTALQNEFKSRVVVEERTKAKYLAEAGAEHLLYLIRTGELGTINSTIDADIVSNELITGVGTYSVLYFPVPPKTTYVYTDSERFLAVGTLDNRTMTLEVNIQENSLLDIKEITN